MRFVFFEKGKKNSLEISSFLQSDLTDVGITKSRFFFLPVFHELCFSFLSQNLLTELKPEQSYRKAAVIKGYFLQFEVLFFFVFF